MKFLTIIGARPQFIKAAPLSTELRKRHNEVLVHTGQHYDANMSDVFFDELGIPKPDYNLGIGGGMHGEQTGRMLEAIEKVLLKERPDVVIIYGDTNSTLAASLAAAKLHIPVAHIEAGLRNFDRRIPEEINRIVADHMASWCFCPSESAVKLLAAEGVVGGVHDVGDIMIDSINTFVKKAEEKSVILEKNGLCHGEYVLATVHRASNTDDPQMLDVIFSALARLSKKVFLPLHPRTRMALERAGLFTSVVNNPNIIISEPLGYLDSLKLQKNAAMVITDSGGVQKEAYYLNRPCVVLMEHTPWEELVETGWVREWNLTAEDLVLKSESIMSAKMLPDHPALYGDGCAAQKIVEVLCSDLENGNVYLYR